MKRLALVGCFVMALMVYVLFRSESPSVRETGLWRLGEATCSQIKGRKLVVSRMHASLSRGEDVPGLLARVRALIVSMPQDAQWARALDREVLKWRAHGALNTEEKKLLVRNVLAVLNEKHAKKKC